ncbi:MAG: hypothetical protein IKX96_02100 [Firmicutes bacterium]|nr:hypothetical protein [Bacillota bacterium]
MDKKELFESVNPAKALSIMALPTIGSQIILLLYNLADTWFIGRTNNPYMIAASSLVVTVYLAVVALANVFGVGGSSLMVRLMGDKNTDEARRVASYSIIAAVTAALVFSLATLICLKPLLLAMGASDNTFLYGRQYLIATTVIGAAPTVLAMVMPMLLRNAGYAKEAGFGVALGGILNIFLDPLFMFVILPKGYEVLGAGIATMMSNVISTIYFIAIFRKVRETTVLEIPKKLITIEQDSKRSFYSVGIPAAFAIFLFDLVTIVINRLTVSYGDIPLAAMGIVLKLERLPLNVGLGICLGMVPLIAYNYSAKNYDRMMKFASLARIAILSFSGICIILFWFFAEPITASFIKDEETVRYAAMILKGRCFAMPFMLIGYHVVNFMNAVDRGKVSFLLAVIRHLVLIIPLLFIMNAVFGFTGLIWSQLAADVLNALVAVIIYSKVKAEILNS